MEKLAAIIRRVYSYEKNSPLEVEYLSRVLLLLAVVILAVNGFANSWATPGLYLFCIASAAVAVAAAFLLRKVKNVRAIAKISSVLFLAFGLVCLYFGTNEAFQTLWYFLFPLISVIHLGLPFGVPLCTIYGICAAVFFWTPLHNMAAYAYSRDFCFYYPVFYFSFFLLIFVADLVYKMYRIEHEESERAMQKEIADTVRDAQTLMLNSVTAISRMIDEKDRYTRQHSQRVAEYSCLIAENYPGSPFDSKQLENLYRSALLHDIGKIAIPDAILKKTDRLTDEEYAIMKTHPVWGRRILAALSFLPQADLGASYHHERYDGKGYPDAIPSGQLPLSVRIISAADTLDAMNSNRCYRRHCNRAYILQELRKGRGTQFDPTVADVVTALIESGRIAIQEETDTR